jgi:hypothetical protein
MRTIDYFAGMVSCATSDGYEQNAEIKVNRVINIRRKLRSGKYNLSENLSVAIDRLLEEILEDHPEKSR